MFERLLVPTDGSPASICAARLAARLAGSTGHLTLLHVSSDAELVALAGLDATSSALAGVPSDLVDVRRHELEAEASSVVARTRDAVRGASCPIDLRTSHGRASHAVLEALATPDFDAVVLGTRGRGLLARALLGSVSDAVVKGATCPALVARHESVQRILVGIDGTPGAIRAAKGAGLLAERLGVPVDLLCAFEFPLDTYPRQRDALRAAFERQAESHFAAVRSFLPAGGAAEVVFHEPAHALTHTAERDGADLIVLGRHGQAASPRAPGTVALRVAMSAHASVLVVP